jgi:hypothetical protein
MIDNWLGWTARSELAGCPMMTASQEFDNKPGPVRDAVVEHMRRLHDSLVKSVQMAIDNREFAADTDAQQVAFELFGIISSCYRSRNLFNDSRADERARRAFERLIDSCLAPVPATAAAANPAQP